MKWNRGGCLPENLKKKGLLFTESGDAAINVVHRDCRGLVLYTNQERISQWRRATEVEAHAVLERIKISTDLVQMPAIVSKTMRGLYEP
jgi:hypothetical protein